MSAHRSRGSYDRIKVIILAITRNPRQMAGQLLIASKLLVRRLKRLPFMGQFALTVSLILCTLIYGSIFYWMFGNQLKSNSFLQVDKCPACFGFKLCDDAKAGNVWFTGFSKIRFLDYVNVANTFTGYANGKNVVIKKLGKDAEISQWEETICKAAKQQQHCDVSKAASQAFTASGTSWIVARLAGVSNMTLCPTERLIDKMMDRYQEKLDAVDISARERVQLITTVLLSPEPILFQTFQRSDGWPFLQYLGGCGRFVAYDGSWQPLYDFVGAEWITRASLAQQLLTIASKLTDNKSQYGIYWTDISLADFGVDTESGDVIIVNGRNLMVVDRYQIKEDKKSGWDRPVYSQFDQCTEIGDSCHMSMDESRSLCEHHVTDRNYYAVCRYLLSPIFSRYRGRPLRGLLSDVPSDVDKLHGITELVNTCAKPTRPGARFDVAAQLMKALSELVQQQ